MERQPANNVKYLSQVSHSTKVVGACETFLKLKVSLRTFRGSKLEID